MVLIKVNYISQMKIIPKSDRNYLIPLSPIDSSINKDIININQPSLINDDRITSYIDPSLPIKQYIFEFNNQITKD